MALSFVEFSLSSSSIIRQYPELASTTENTLAFGILDTIPLTVVVGEMFTLNGLVKISGVYACVYPAIGLTTVTMLLTHSVDSLTFLMTFSFSIFSSSALTFSRTVTGTLQGGWTTGLYERSVVMWCVTPSMLPQCSCVSALTSFTMKCMYIVTITNNSNNVTSPLHLVLRKVASS